MDTTDHPQRLNPRDFFDLALDGATMTAAQLATGIAYSTIHRARSGGVISVETAKALAEWSRGLESAQARGVVIDAALSVGITDGQAA